MADTSIVEPRPNPKMASTPTVRQPSTEAKGNGTAAACTDDHGPAGQDAPDPASGSHDNSRIDGPTKANSLSNTHTRNGSLQAQEAARAAAAAASVPAALNAAAVGLTTALGFQVGGIAAGSMAAAMMRLADVACIGAAGSVVGPMQSVGATGVASGLVGWVAMGAVGLLLGSRNIVQKISRQQ